MNVAAFAWQSVSELQFVCCSVCVFVSRDKVLQCVYCSVRVAQCMCVLQCVCVAVYVCVPEPSRSVAM